jgi:hypothetical protein
VPVALGKAIGLTILEHIRTQGSEDPSPGFKYSRYTGTSDRDWCAVDAAKARLAEIAPKVRRINKQTRKSLLVTIRNVLPRVRIAGRLLIEAKSLCRRCKILWLPWVRQTCRMSKRSAQAYMRIARNWKAIVEAQRSAPLTSIDAVLTFLAQPKDKPKTATGENGHGAGAGGGVDGHHADDAPAATTSSLKGSGTNGNTAVPAGATAATEPASGGDPPDITPERRRELEVALKDLVRRRDRRTREIFPLVAELVSGLAADVQVGEWDKEDRRNLSKVTDRMTASLAGIKSTLASWQPPSDSARR